MTTGILEDRDDEDLIHKTHSFVLKCEQKTTQHSLTVGEIIFI